MGWIDTKPTSKDCKQFLTSTLCVGWGGVGVVMPLMQKKVNKNNLHNNKQESLHIQWNKKKGL